MLFHKTILSGFETKMDVAFETFYDRSWIFYLVDVFLLYYFERL